MILSNKQVSQNGHGHLVERSNNGIRRGTRRCHTRQGGKVEKESDKAGKDIF